MHQDKSGTGAAGSTEPHIPQDIILELLHCQLRNNITPLSLEIDCSALRHWGEVHHMARFRSQYLIKELKIWGNYLGKRPLNRISLNEPFTIMDAPGLTELIHTAGEHLKITQGHHVEHAACLRQEEITTENLALLKGLQFNHIHMLVDPDFEVETLKRLQQQIKDYKIPYFSLTVSAGRPPERLLPKLMELLSFVGPETINLNWSEPQVAYDFGRWTGPLMQFGYYHQIDERKTRCRTVRFHSNLHSPPVDRVALGPGASSQLGKLRATNFTHPEAYQQRLAKSSLPIATCR